MLKRLSPERLSPVTPATALLLMAVAALLLMAVAAAAAPVTYPGPAYIDDAGVRVTPTSVTVASIATKAGVAITGATVTPNISGSNSSVDYDAALYGEAWVTLAPVLSGHTFVNNPPTIFCAADPQTLAQAAASAAKVGTNGGDSPNAATAQGLVAATNTLAAATGVKVGAGAVGFAQLTAALGDLLSRSYLVSTGATTPPSADDWGVAGIYQGVPFYASNATNLFAWYNGTNWVISPTVGTNGTAYWTGGASVTAAYTAAGTATGTPALVGHGNAILSSFQPDVTPPAVDGSGNVRLQAGEHTEIVADAAAALTAQGYTPTRAGRLDDLTGDFYGLVSPLIASGKFTAGALSNAPSGGGSGLTSQQVANAVWDEPTANHTTASTFGPYLSALPSASAVAAAISSLNVGGTAGSLTDRAAKAISASIQGGSYLAGSINTGTHQQTVTYYLPGTTLSAMNAGTATVIDTALVTYASNNTTIVSRVDTPGSF